MNYKKATLQLKSSNDQFGRGSFHVITMSDGTIEKDIYSNSDITKALEYYQEVFKKLSELHNEEIDKSLFLK